MKKTEHDKDLEEKAQKGKAKKDSSPYYDNPEENSEIVFYYSREHRLSKASPLVLAHNRNTNTRPGFAKSFAGSRSNFITLMVVLACVIFVMGYHSSPGQQNTIFNLGNNKIIPSVIEDINPEARDEKILFFSIQKTRPNQEDVYIGLVDIAVSPVLPKNAGEPPVVIERIVFSLNSPEDFRFSLPFWAKDFIVIFQTEDETIIRRVKKAP